MIFNYERVWVFTRRARSTFSPHFASTETCFHMLISLSWRTRLQHVILIWWVISFFSWKLFVIAKNDIVAKWTGPERRGSITNSWLARWHTRYFSRDHANMQVDALAHSLSTTLRYQRWTKWLWGALSCMTATTTLVMSVNSRAHMYRACHDYFVVTFVMTNGRLDVLAWMWTKWECSAIFAHHSYSTSHRNLANRGCDDSTSKRRLPIPLCPMFISFRSCTKIVDSLIWTLALAW